jgi:RHS repeat-associated protein
VIRLSRPLITFVLMAIFFSCTLRGQQLTGTPPFGSYTGSPDLVDLSNLNVHLSMPVLHKAGRALPFTYDLSFDSSIWYPVGSSGSQVWTPTTTWGWQGALPTTGGFFINYSYAVYGGSCGPPWNQGSYTQYTYSNFVYYDNVGIRHTFGNSNFYMYYYISTGGTGCPPGGAFPSTTQTLAANDGSGLTMNVPPAPYPLNGGTMSPYVVDSGGTKLNVPVITNPAGQWGSLLVTDRNGNQISGDANGNFFDTLSSTVPTVTVAGTGTPASPKTFSYKAPSTQSVSFQLNYTQYTVATNFGVSGISEYGRTSVALATSLALPDSSQYSFSYEQTPSIPASGACTPLAGTYSGYCVTGRIASITLPTGGRITYAYSGGNNGILNDGSPATLTRTTPDGTWAYARVLGTGGASTTTITDPERDSLAPNGNQSVLQFVGLYETQRKIYQGLTSSGTLLKTVNTCYNGATSPCITTAITLPITQRSLLQQYGSSGLQCKQVYSYNTYGSVTEQDDYDYATGAPTTILRKLFISYASLNNGISNLPAKVTTCTGTGTDADCNSAGTKVAQTTYTYDETTPTATSGTPQHTTITGSRGNATTVKQLVQGAATLNKTFTYYDTGTTKTATDVNGAVTTFNYADATSTCGNAFATSVSEPLSLSRSMTWNCTGAVMTQLTDENGQNATTGYTDPYFWRPASKTDPTNAVTNLTYASSSPFNWTEAKMTFNSSNSVVDMLTTVDGLGRIHLRQKRQGPSASNYDSVETDYDSLGRTSRTTLPYSGGSGATCPTGPSCPATTTTYDAMSRISQLTDGGGGTTTSSYSNNDVLVTFGPAPSGENTKRRQLEYDALGRLTSVCEVTAGITAWPGGTCAQNTSQTGYWTNYTFDALGDLLTVTQNAQATAGNRQTRTYTYDAMQRLTSDKNPEANQVATTYTYDSDSTCTPASAGDKVKRTDAVGNTTCYAYDQLHRVTSVTYPSGSYAGVTAPKTFVYDSATVNGQAMLNAKGRLAEAFTGPSSTKITDLGFAYTVRGETSDVYELTPHSNSSYYHVSQTYWPNGAVSQVSSNIAGLPMINYGGTIGSTVGLDGEGRVTQVTAGSGQNPVTGVNYNTSSEPTAVTFGSGDADGFSYDSNTSRMTQFKFNIGTSSQSLTGTLTWNANASLGQLAITDQFNSSDTQTCTYVHDDLTRIVSANCGSAASQTFSYDPFGNINKSGSPYSFQPSYSVSTNRMISLPGNFTPTYDANGNVTNDSNHTYAWDADGNSISIDTAGLTFDALDRTVEQNRSGTYTEVVYAPSGGKLALMSGTSGQTLQKAFIPLPGRDSAIYTSSGLDHYRHSDWLGSSRLASTPSRAVASTVAYAPFGESYASYGTPDLSFTDQNQDAVSGDYDFMAREYSIEGRWPAPDPAGLAAAHPADPRSWNRYAYVLNNPLNAIDPLGLFCAWDDGSFDDVVSEGGLSNGDCNAQGGTWIDGNSPGFNPNPDAKIAKLVSDIQELTQEFNDVLADLEQNGLRRQGNTWLNGILNNIDSTAQLVENYTNAVYGVGSFDVAYFGCTDQTYYLLNQMGSNNVNTNYIWTFSVNDGTFHTNATATSNNPLSVSLTLDPLYGKVTAQVSNP